MAEAPVIQSAPEVPPFPIPEGATPLEIGGRATIELRLLPPENPFLTPGGHRDQYADLRDEYRRRINEASEKGITPDAMREEGIRQATIEAEEAQTANARLDAEYNQKGNFLSMLPSDHPAVIEKNRVNRILQRTRTLKTQGFLK